MDIRKWLTKKPTSTTPNSSVKQSSSSAKKNTSRIIDSDSDEEIHARKKKKSVESASRNKKKRIIDSSDESDDEPTAKKSKKYESDKNKRSMRMQISDSSTEEVSPVKRKPSPVKSKLKPQNKLENLKYTSKFFKEKSATDVFGDEPVKRSDKKLKELKEKLKTFKSDKKDQILDDDADFETALNSTNDIFGDKRVKRSDKKLRESKEKSKTYKPVKKDLTLDDDADFEAALLQLDEIGENWADLSEISENKLSSSSNTNLAKSPKQKQSIPEKEKIVRSSKADKDPKKILTLPDSLSSGYGSAELDDSSSEMNASVVTSKLKVCGVSNEAKKEAIKAGSKRPSVPAANKNEEKPAQKSVSADKPVKQVSSDVPLPSSSSEDFSLWVEKYKPQSSKKIIGQQGEKSNVNKLIHWLKNWYKNNAGSKKASFVPGGWNKDPTGACFKAALLSGPPGVGKTTTVSLVCKELGFDLVEFNASDTRSKKLLQEEVSELLKCTSLSPFFTRQNSESTAVTKKHVLVMDEVDGMAGNEDRGGIQELIQLIKFTKVPVICMCNDRNHPKIRSLVNYCFDLRFSRPRVEQIKGYMMSVCYKEKLRIHSDALVDIITSANNDVRLVLNHLSMLAADNSQNLEAAKKYVKLSAWDVLRKVFSKDDHKKMSIHDKCDLFFFDYGIAPLFVQENYLSIKPLNVEAQSKKSKMELYARAAKCIGLGDLIDQRIRKNSSWSLLPTQAIFASYAPGEILEGYCSAQINFPSWLGKNSKKGRIDRLLQEVQIHTRLKISGSKESVNLDYASHLKNRILSPLVERGTEGVKEALDMLHEYDLLKEDLDSLQEICQWPNSVNTMANLETKVKSAFTRAYNKNPPVRPYSLTAPIKKAAAVESLPYEEVEGDEENEKSDNDDADAMIVMKKRPAAKKSDDIPASTSKAKAKTNTSTSQSKRSRKK